MVAADKTALALKALDDLVWGREPTGYASAAEVVEDVRRLVGVRAVLDLAGRLEKQRRQEESWKRSSTRTR